jgi:hypothetical protein
MVGPHSSAHLQVLYRQPLNGSAYQWRIQAILSSSPLVIRRELGASNGQTFTSLAELEALAERLSSLEHAPIPSTDGSHRFTELMV